MCNICYCTAWTEIGVYVDWMEWKATIILKYFIYYVSDREWPWLASVGVFHMDCRGCTFRAICYVYIKENEDATIYNNNTCKMDSSKWIWFHAKLVAFMSKWWGEITTIPLQWCQNVLQLAISSFLAREHCNFTAQKKIKQMAIVGMRLRSQRIRREGYISRVEWWFNLAPFKNEMSLGFPFTQCLLHPGLTWHTKMRKLNYIPKSGGHKHQWHFLRLTMAIQRWVLNKHTPRK